MRSIIRLWNDLSKKYSAIERFSYGWYLKDRLKLTHINEYPEKISVLGKSFPKSKLMLDAILDDDKSLSDVIFDWIKYNSVPQQPRLEAIRDFFDEFKKNITLKQHSIVEYKKFVERKIDVVDEIDKHGSEYIDAHSVSDNRRGQFNIYDLLTYLGNIRKIVVKKSEIEIVEKVIVKFVLKLSDEPQTFRSYLFFVFFKNLLNDTPKDGDMTVLSKEINSIIDKSIENYNLRLPLFSKIAIASLSLVVLHLTRNIFKYLFLLFAVAVLWIRSELETPTQNIVVENAESVTLPIVSDIIVDTTEKSLAEQISQMYGVYLSTKPVQNTDAEIWLLKARYEADVDKKMMYLNKSIGFDSTFGEAYTLRAFTEFSSGQFDNAMLDVEKAIKYNDSDYEVNYMDYLTRSVINLSLNKYQEAKLDCDTSIVRVLNFFDLVYFSDSSFYIEAGYSSLKQFRNETISLMYYNRAKANSFLSDHKSARADLDTALKINPTDKEALIAKGDNYFFLKEYKAAIDHDQNILKTMNAINNADIVDIYISIGMSYYELAQQRHTDNSFAGISFRKEHLRNAIACLDSAFSSSINKNEMIKEKQLLNNCVDEYNELKRKYVMVP